MKIHDLSGFILIAFCLIITCGGGSERNKESNIHKVETGLTMGIQIKGELIRHFNILDRMKDYHVPGVSIAIVYDGKLNWAKRYGNARIENKVLIDSLT